MTIRTLVESDLPKIKEIDRAAFSAEEQYDDGMYDRMLQSGRSLVALDGGQVVGYAFVQIDPYPHVRSLAIHPSHHRRGFGRALLQAVIDRGEHQVDLLVDEANTPAVRLYEQLGFRRAEMCATVPPKRRMILQLD
jgi:ribosomal protein S18 acetylase RimI-like enzyme